MEIIHVDCEDCGKKIEVDHISEVTYTIFADGVPVGKHKLCRKCAGKLDAVGLQ